MFPAPHVYRPLECWQLAYCLLSALCCRGPLGNNLQVILAFDRVCMMWEEVVGVVVQCVGSHLFAQEAGPFGVLVHAVCAPSTQPPAPLLHLCLPVFPQRSSPPARLTDRQMLSAAHLQLWASITPHKQPIACTQAANFVCLSPFR